MAPHDLALWNISMMNRSLLKAASYEAMFTDTKLRNGKPTSYGLGVQVSERDGQPVISHSASVRLRVTEHDLSREQSGRDRINEYRRIERGGSHRTSTDADRLGDPKRWWLVAGRNTSGGGARTEDLQRSAEWRDRPRAADGAMQPLLHRRALQDFASSLKPLGTPQSFTQVAMEPRGGMVFRAFRVEFPTRNLTVTTMKSPTANLEQYLVLPVSR